MENRSVASLQYARAIAALLVIFQHAHEQIADLQRFMNTRIGEAGVDLFFVISGFVMIYTTVSGRDGPGTFILKRILRIVPLYWLMTAFTAAMLIFMPGLARDSVFTVPSFLMSLGFWPHENPVGRVDYICPMLKLGWTLNYEMFFYVTFAALLWLAPIRRTWAIAILFSALAVATAVVDPRATPFRFWGEPIILEFVLGCAIGCFYLYGKPLPRWAIMGLALVGAGLFVGLADAKLHRVLSHGLPAAMLIWAACEAERSGWLKWRSGVLGRLGDASYSIYLAHLYAVVACRVLWERLNLPVDQPIFAVFFVAICICLGIGAGLVVHILVERPLQHASAGIVRRIRKAPDRQALELGGGQDGSPAAHAGTPS